MYNARANLLYWLLKRHCRGLLVSNDPFICFSFSWLKSLWRRKCCSSKVGASGEITFNVEDYLESERCKEELGDFTLSEYNEKGTQLKYLVLSCASLFSITWPSRSLPIIWKPAFRLVSCVVARHTRKVINILPEKCGTLTDRREKRFQEFYIKNISRPRYNGGPNILYIT